MRATCGRAIVGVPPVCTSGPRTATATLGQTIEQIDAWIRPGAAAGEAPPAKASSRKAAAGAGAKAARPKRSPRATPADLPATSATASARSAD